MESFVTELHIRQCLDLPDFSIPLGANERKHLLITGKNGSGKTTLLKLIEKHLNGLVNSGRAVLDEAAKRLGVGDTGNASRPRLDPTVHETQRDIQIFRDRLDEFGPCDLSFTNQAAVFDAIFEGAYLVAAFEAKRSIGVSVPAGVQRVDLASKPGPTQREHSKFLQFIVNLKASRSFARDDGNMAEVEKIDKWFERFEGQLRQIFGCDELRLVFDRKNFNFEIALNGHSPFGFNALSDGYSAIINIVTELLIRMEAHACSGYDMEGLVLIDEIETHLHVDLQKRVLPFLTQFFPNLQFIVTTHSPFVLSSIDNAVICDLEKQIITGDLSGYSYDALIESYFGSDKYSDEVKRKLATYESLTERSDLSDDERDQLYALEGYFDGLPKYLEPELDVKLQQIKLRQLGKGRK